MFKNRFLLLPFLVFITAFILDKILLLENIQTYFTKTMSEVNYQLKPELYEELKQYLAKHDRKKVLVYFGNSRALLFDNEYIEKTYPQWILYNFSVPGGSPDYTKYWLEIFKKENVRPDFILLDESIEIYNAENRIQIDEVLLNGISVSFLLRHLDRYSSKEFSDFVSKRLFQVYKYRPKLATIKERIEDDFRGLEMYRNWRKEIKSRLRKDRGSSSPNFMPGGVASEDQLLKFSEGDFQSYLGSFRLKKSMMAFQGESIQLIKELQIPYSVIWVRLSRPYFSLVMNREIQTDKGKSSAFNAWFPEMQKLHQQTTTDFWDMNRDASYSCDKFSDAGHMAPVCYKDYTDFIFTSLGKKG